MKKAVYKRVLIKVSGEALACKTESGKSFGIDSNMLAGVAENIKRIYDMDVEIAVVVGGGNFWRGAQNGTMDRTRADHIGMLATVMNSLALADAIEQQGIPVRVQTAIEMREIAEQYIRNKAVRHLEKGRVTIFGCGTAIAYSTTNEKYSDFRILYGFTKGSALNYYLYDTTEGTLQRCVDPSILYGTTSESNTPSEEDIPTATPAEGTPSEPTSTPEQIPVYPKNEFQIDKKLLIPIIIAICVASVIIAIIIILVRSKRIADRFDNDYENFVAQPEENIDYDTDVKEESEFENEIEIETNDVPESVPDIDTDISEELETEIEMETEIAEESATESFSSYYNLDDDEDEILQLRND